MNPSENEPLKMSVGNKVWHVIKRILGFILPFIILFSIPVIFFYLLYNVPSLFGGGNIKPDYRQDYLESNWERYTTRGGKWTIPELDGKLELSLCPFADDNWNKSISPEEAGFICGYVTVPLFHDQPEGDTIQIPIAIWPDYQTPPYWRPLFITHGGPGGSALGMYPRMFYPDRVGGQRDIVIIDQRGTQYAKPSLDCPEVTESSKNGVEGYQEYLSYCRARLTGKGTDLAAFTTPEIARDFEIVRQTLGYKEFNFYGVSYGTHVGQYLAAYYPESVRSLILDGVAPIPMDYLNRSVSTHNRILNEFFTNCEQDPTCSAQYPDLAENLNDIIENLDQNPKSIRIHVPDSVYSFADELDGESFYYILLSSSYWDDNYAAVPFIIHQAGMNRFDSSITFVESFIAHFLGTSGAFYSVICAEHTPMTVLSDSDPILNPSIMGWEIENHSDNREECLNWNVPLSPYVLETLPISDVPTLLLSGFFDPVTPPEYAEIALKSFPNGQHLIDPVGSHGIAFNDDCTRRIVEDFLDRPANLVRSDCLSDPDRRISQVPRSALSIPFLRRSNNIADSYKYLSSFVFLIMITRSILLGIRRLWKIKRKTWIKRSPIEWVLHRRFELASWIFILCSFGLGVGLEHFRGQLSQLPAYWNASALPGESRWVLMIPILLAMILPVVVIPGFKLWKFNKNVFRRTYYLFQVVFCSALVAYLTYSNMLFIWLR